MFWHESWFIKREMDEEIWENIEPEEFTVQVIDPEYEFDAPRYFDFARPESDSEAREAERWFDTAGTCPPSPFVIKWNWIPVVTAYTLKKPEDGENISVHSDSDISMVTEVTEIDKNSRELYSQNEMTQDIPKFKSKTAVKSSLSSNSTLMRPTASYLAKQNQRLDVYSRHDRGRSQKAVAKIDEKSSRNPVVIESQATKRQKLDSGYLRKVTHPKHHTLLHKISKKGGVDISSSCVRLKVTIPREPTLETAHRAQRHRLTSADALKHENCKIDRSFRTCPLNKKILSSRGELGVSRNINRVATIPMEFKFPTDKRFSRTLPIELFSKLSLASDYQPDTVSQPLTHLPTKGSKENVPVSVCQELGMKNGIREKQQKMGEKQSQCGSDKRNSKYVFLNQ